MELVKLIITTLLIGTYHVISAVILSVNDTTVCLECRFKHKSPSTGCYAAFHPINATGEGFLLYYKIIKSPHDTTASDCISTIPNGVYSISILDALNYEEGMLNNTAINISSLITIHRMTTNIMLVSSMSLTPTTTTSLGINALYTCINTVILCSLYLVDIDISFSPPFSTNYNDSAVTMSSKGSGPSVLTVTLSVGTAVIVLIMTIVITAVIVGLCITKRIKRNNKSK